MYECIFELYELYELYEFMNLWVYEFELIFFFKFMNLNDEFFELYEYLSSGCLTGKLYLHIILTSVLDTSTHLA